MLYNPQWSGVSLAGFIGWLETKDPKARYQFNECEGRCLLGQYMEAMGIEWTGAPSDAYGADWGKSSYIKVARKIFGEGTTFDVLAHRPHTFGAALKRARSRQLETMGRSRD